MIEAAQYNKPWYRQFWAWFILSPLIVVFIVSSITITLAVKGADDRVLDNYYKEGRMINIRLEEDLLASALNISANIEFDIDINELTLQLKQDSAGLPEQLKLEFSHPAKAALDHTLLLNRIAENQYQAELSDKLLLSRWYLRLLPTLEDDSQQSWRLRGEMDFAKSHSIILKPDS
ncbi:MAG: FixH family protein [Cellvibrionaceae bacterium]